MDKAISDIMQKVIKVGATIDQLKNELQEFTDSYNPKNATIEERTTLRRFDSFLDKMEDVSNMIDFYKKPITAKGKLHKNSNGRYMIGDDTELTCGATIEILCDRWQEGEEWFRTRLEAENGEYYIVDYPYNFDGVMARVRR